MAPVTALQQLAAAVGLCGPDGRIDWDAVAADDPARSAGEQAVVGWLRLVARRDPLLSALDAQHGALVLAALREVLRPAGVHVPSDVGVGVLPVGTVDALTADPTHAAEP